MDFQKVTFDTDVDELEAEDARELVTEFQNAQEQNIAEFEDASESIEALEGRVQTAQEAALGEFDDEEALTEALVDASPLGEDDVAEFSVFRKADLLADFSADEEEADEGDAEAEFSNMGQRGETHDEDEANRTFAEDHLGEIDGLVF